MDTHLPSGDGWKHLLLSWRMDAGEGRQRPSSSHCSLVFATVELSMGCLVVILGCSGMGLFTCSTSCRRRGEEIALKVTGDVSEGLRTMKIRSIRPCACSEKNSECCLWRWVLCPHSKVFLIALPEEAVLIEPQRYLSRNQEQCTDSRGRVLDISAP